MSRRPSPPLPLHLRFTAGLAALLVALLGLLAANPALHHALHDDRSTGDAPAHHCSHASGDTAAPHSAPDDDAGCVVDVFAQGAPLLAEPPRLPQPQTIRETTGRREVARHVPVPAHLHPESCGPPTVAS